MGPQAPRTHFPEGAGALEHPVLGAYALNAIKKIIGLWNSFHNDFCGHKKGLER